MTRFFSLVLMCGLLSGTAQAQVVSVQVGLPMFRWEVRPAMVQIEPDYWVVEDYDNEVFFFNGWYWTFQSNRWYRTNDHSGHWAHVEREHVPARFYAQQPGHYRHYRGSGPRDNGHYRPQGWRDQDYARPAAHRAPAPAHVRPAPRHDASPPGHQQKHDQRAKPGKSKQKQGGKHGNGQGHH